MLALGYHGIKLYFVKSDGFTILDLYLLEKSKTIDPETGQNFIIDYNQMIKKTNALNQSSKSDTVHFWLQKNSFLKITPTATPGEDSSLMKPSSSIKAILTLYSLEENP